MPSRSLSVCTFWLAAILLLGSQRAHAKGSGAPARELLLEAVGVYEHRVWFAEELAPLADALAEVLGKPPFGYRVIPPAELRKLWAEVQQGRLPGRAGVCALPPPPALLAEHLHPDALWTRPEIRCAKGGCRLELVLWQRKPAKDDERRDKQVGGFSARLPLKEGVAEWAARIRRDGLKRGVKAREGGLIGTLGGAPAPELQVNLSYVTQSGDWSYRLASDRFQPKVKEFHACVSSPRRWADWWAQSFVVEVNAAGRVDRCEATHPDHLPPPEFACQCGVLGKMDFQPGASGRRASFYVDLIVPRAPVPDDGYYRNAYVAEKHADDRSAILGSGEVESEALLACLRPVRANLGDLKVPAHFSVGADGIPTSVAVEWPPSLPPQVAQCLDDVVRAARFNCPLSGKAEVDAGLSISVARR
jgi:hypothetical protein